MPRPKIKPWRQDEVRAQIQASLLVRRLTDHAKGEIDLSPTQIAAIRILLDKSLPNLATIEHAGYIGSSDPVEISEEELLRLARGGAPRVSGPALQDHRIIDIEVESPDGQPH